MHWTSIIAIYLLLWVMSAFLLLPFGVKTAEEAGVETVKGQAESAPANFQPGKVAKRATVLAALFCALYVANYSYGWITPEDINVFGSPPVQTTNA